MARKTECLTPNCQFHIGINSKGVSVQVVFSKPIHFSKREAKLVEDLLHNSVETVLRPYFKTHRKSKRLFLARWLARRIKNGS